MKIEDPKNVIPGFILIMILPYILLGLMIMIYFKFKSIYKRHKIIYFIILFFVLLYVSLASLYNYYMGVIAGYKTGLDSVKISL